MEDGAPLVDPPMSQFERETIQTIRQVFPRPQYTVYKIRQDVKNVTGLTWNVDYCVAVGPHKIVMLIKALDEDTTTSNIDQRMRDAYAIFSLHRETSNGGLYTDVHWRLMLAKDEVLDALGAEGYQPYRYAFESLSVRIQRMSTVPDELKRIRREMAEAGF